ncbi:hypothetical protein [Hazenella coriacea]|uniref:Uncharacterized protein n=1 Tax=Hazenella coriacea TaxID=1179467 RepID=A0A4R3L1P3_9BACL|nr:hypothetical protein [Hazenella coriacea]TCS92388.1 hypothetical protein EDD58_11211 [Hazenella coriacea]
MEFIADNKWWLLVTAEVIFWISLVVFFVVRYWFRNEGVSRKLFIITILNEIFIAFLAIVDYMETGQFSRFQGLVILILIYGFTYGKKDFARLDLFIKRFVANLRGEHDPTLDRQLKEQEAEKYGTAHAKKERKRTIMHVGVYVIAHIVFIFIVGVHDDPRLPSIFSGEFFSVRFEQPEIGFYQSEQVNQVSLVWSILLLIDVVMAIWYTLFPKNKK